MNRKKSCTSLSNQWVCAIKDFSPNIKDCCCMIPIKQLPGKPHFYPQQHQNLISHLRDWRSPITTPASIKNFVFPGMTGSVVPIHLFDMVRQLNNQWALGSLLFHFNTSRSHHRLAIKIEVTCFTILNSQQRRRLENGFDPMSNQNRI